MGSALPWPARFFGLDCKVFMVRVSYDQKPYRRALMEAFGASVTASRARRRSQAGDSRRASTANGSLGIAISEPWNRREGPEHQVRAGSVLNHVLLHQTVIGWSNRADGYGG